MKQKYNEHDLNREKYLSTYSFYIAALSLPAIGGINLFLESADPIEQVFYENFIILAYIILGFPLVIRLIAIFKKIIGIKLTQKLLTKNQKHNYASYELAVLDSNFKHPLFDQAKQTLYFTACNNVVWIYYIAVVIYFFTTIMMETLFEIPNGIYNVIPAIIFLIFKGYKIFKA